MISGWVGQYTCISFSLCIGLFHWSKIFSVGTSPALSVLSFDPFAAKVQVALTLENWALGMIRLVLYARQTKLLRF